MATAEELLNSVLKNEASVLSASDAVFVIDGESRTINVPDSERLFGVEGDKDVERKYFQCPKIVGDNIDLSQHQIYVSYAFTTTENSTSFPDADGLYHCEDVEVSGDNITFSWLLSGNVFANPGFIAFKVMAKKSEGEELKTKWNTAPAIGSVLLTVPDGEEIAEEYPDIINQLLTKMESVEQIATPEAMQGYVNAYLEENPVTGGMTEEQKQQLNQNTTDVAGLKSALEQKADIFYTNESQLKDFGQTVTEERLMVVFGDSSNPVKDYEQILTNNAHLYVCVRAKQDYWNQGTGVQLNVLSGYAQSVKLIGDNFYTATSVKDDLGKYVFAYMTLNCAEILAAIKQNIEENSYSEVYGFQFRVAEDWKISSYNTPWCIGVTTVEPTQEMYERNFQTSDISEDFRNAVIMVTGGENNPDTEPDLSPLSGKYCLAIGDSYTYALAGESGALTTYNASLGMAGTLNYGIVSSTIRDRSSSDNGFAFKPMVCRVCHIPSKDSSGETLVGEEVPLDREDIGYVTFMGGTNDSFTYPDSTGTDLCDGDQTHIYGGVNLILSKLVESYPDVPIIVILQPYYANNTSTEVTDMSGNKNTVDVSTLNSKFMSMTTQVRKQRIVKEVAEFFSKAYKNIHVIDCCFNWFNPLKEEEYATFWSQADNGLHLSYNGYNQIVNGERYDSISKKINEIFTVNTNNI